jgi:hypothetical protein
VTAATERRVAAVAAIALIVMAATAGCDLGSAEATAPLAHGAGEWRAENGEFLLGGVQVDEPDRGRWLASLEAAGFNTLALTVYADQGDWDSADLRFSTEAPWIAEEARAAKAAGLRVALVLRVVLDSGVERNRFLWHGMIMPREDAQVAAWFDRYLQFVSAWATVAAATGIDVLGIGSELNALASTRPVDVVPELEAYYLDPGKQSELRHRVTRFEGSIDPQHLHGGWRETYASVPRYIDDQIEAHRRWVAQVTGSIAGAPPEQVIATINRRRALLAREWDELIGAVRAVYSGELTYAANFDQYRAVGFWPSLDLIGINAYFPLRAHPIGASDPSALESELEASWRRIFGEIRAFRAEAGAGDLPVLFTELGYTSRVDCTIEPWSSSGFSLVGDWDDPELMVWAQRERGTQERALAVRALRRASAADPGLLRGLLWWKLSTLRAHEAIEPFVLVIGDETPPDPLSVELRAFRGKGEPP